MSWFRWFSRSKCPVPKSGVLLLPLATIEMTPAFFCVLSGVLRAGGFRIVVLADTKAKSPAMEAAHYEVSFHEVRETSEMVKRSAATLQLWKLTEARELSRSYAPVIWIDVDFANWKGESIDGNIVSLNWASTLSKIRSGVGLTNPGVA